MNRPKPAAADGGGDAEQDADDAGQQRGEQGDGGGDRQPGGEVVADGPAVDERRAEVDRDQVAEVVEELDDQSGRSQPSSWFFAAICGGGAAGAEHDGAGAAVGGVHQQEADQDGGEHRADRERQPTGDVGEHVGFLRLG